MTSIPCIGHKFPGACKQTVHGIQIECMHPRFDCGILLFYITRKHKGTSNNTAPKPCNEIPPPKCQTPCLALPSHQALQQLAALAVPAASIRAAALAAAGQAAAVC